MFTKRQRIYIVNYFTTKSYQKMISLFKCKFPLIFLFKCKFPFVSQPNNASISHLVKKFHEENTVVKNLPHQRLCYILKPTKMSKISMKLSTRPQTLVRKVLAQGKNSHLSTHQATKLLKLYFYKVSMVEELKPSDCPKRVVLSMTSHKLCL